MSYEDTKKEVKEIDDALSNLQETILNVRDTNKEMGKTFAQNASMSKTWTAASRILSGSGLWKIQNRVRAVIDLMAVYDTMQEKAIKNTTEQTNIMNKFAKAQGKRIELDKKLALIKTADSGIIEAEYEKLGILDAMGKSTEQLLNEEFASYALAKKKGATHEQALKMLEMELLHTKKLEERQEKRIFGTEKQKEKFRKRQEKWFQKNQARIDLEAKIEKRKDLRAEASQEKLLALKREAATMVEPTLLELSRHSLDTQADMLAAWDNIHKQIDDVTEQISDMDKGAGGLWTDMTTLFKSDMGGIGDKILGKKVLDEEGNETGERKGGFAGLWKAAERREKWENFSAKMQDNAGKFRDNIRMKLLPKIYMFLRNMLMGFLYFTIFLAAAFVVFKLLQTAWNDFTGRWDEIFPIFDEKFAAISELMDDLWTSAEDLWVAFTTGGLGEFINKSFVFLGKLLHLGIKLLGVIWEVAWQVIKSLWTGFLSLLWKQPDRIIKGIMVGLAVWGTWMLVKWLGGHLISTMTAIVGAVPMAIIVAGIALLALFVIALQAAIPGWSQGGVHGGGVAMVGEKGPELINLPSGTRIHSNKKSRGMISGQTNNINVSVNGRVGASDSEIRDIARKIGQQLNREINRTTSSATRL